jgi:anti-sigma28 factor (negative regulator of flagellin synthesis)
MRDTPRAAVVRRGKRLVRKGLLVVDPEAVANLMLDEAA